MYHLVASYGNELTTTTTTVLWPFFRYHLGELVPEENLWCKGRLTEADTLTIRLGGTPSGLTNVPTSTILPFFTGQMPFLPSNNSVKALKATRACWIREQTLEFSSAVLPAPCPSLVLSLYFPWQILGSGQTKLS